MAEDERYRTSTQYRLWSYTLDSLASLRDSTNQSAAIRVRAAVERVRQIRAASSKEQSEVDDGMSNSALPEGEVECLTAEEELKLVKYYSGKVLEMAGFLNMPAEARATAAQYFRRFYVTNSVMTYAPTTILKTAIFFTTKTEHHYITVKDFAAGLKNTTPEEILASEFILTQGLRFTFDVRHPFRAHTGATLELQAIAQGKISTGDERIPRGLEERVGALYEPVRNTLKQNAQLTDAYFHYTPSQIMFAAMLLADEEITLWYIGLKTGGDQRVRDKVMATVRQCAEMLRGVQSESSPEEVKELKRLNRKMGKCMNPEKMDLVGLQKAKREGADGLDNEKAVKKRKLERDVIAKAGEDLFGPALVKKT